MKKRVTILAATVTSMAVLALSYPASAFAETPPDGAAVLREAGRHIAASNNVMFDMSMSYRMDVGGKKQSMDADYYFSFQRPNLINARLESEDASVEFVSDGSALITYISELDAYTVTPGEPKASEVLTRSGFGPFAPITAFLGDLIDTEGFATLDDSKVSYVGLEDLNGESYHRLRVENREVASEVWVAAKGEPVIARIRPDEAAMVKPYEDRGMKVDLSINASLRAWDFDTIPTSRFAFTAPEGAEKVESFQAKQAQAPTIESLLGKPAPALSLDIMDGGTLDLASKIGKEIVILDFWATWCGPCRKAMPIIDKVAKEYKGKGVRLYAVNLQEEEKQIKPFLNGQKLDVTVVLDKSGDVSRKFFVNAIPSTVIIAKDGTVQAVHEGLIQDLETVLKRELDTLSENESLVDTKP